MNFSLSELMQNLVDLVLTVVVALLGLRFILKLFGANSANEFVDWVYTNSAEILEPFRGIFTERAVDGLVIEFSTLFAILIYGILGLLAYKAIETLAPNKGRTKRVKSKK